MDINVTQSSMPDFEEYTNLIKKIWDSKHLTNNGPMHKELEKKLIEFLKVDNITLTTNGHTALEIALDYFDLKGEVITTPYTFISTTHSISRMGLKPVFCDIDPETYMIDVNKIEDLITDQTVAIMPVHVYGNICDVESIEEIAERHGIKVIYDAAHAFGVEYKGRGIGSYGDFSMFSFHATKVFNTVEGGAITYNNQNDYSKLNSLKNFGIVSPEEIKYISGNAKMDEFRSAMGLANLKHIESEIEKRERVFNRYQSHLEDVAGIKTMSYREGLKPNYAYYPVVFDKERFGKNRDEIFDLLKSQNINARKYFYPATNEVDCYKNDENNLSTPVASEISKNVLCLPLYSELDLEDVDRICEIILGK